MNLSMPLFSRTAFALHVPVIFFRIFGNVHDLCLSSAVYVFFSIAEEIRGFFIPRIPVSLSSRRATTPDCHFFLLVSGCKPVMKPRIPFFFCVSRSGTFTVNARFCTSATLFVSSFAMSYLVRRFYGLSLLFCFVSPFPFPHLVSVST